MIEPQSGAARRVGLRAEADRSPESAPSSRCRDRRESRRDTRRRRFGRGRLLALDDADLPLRASAFRKREPRKRKM